MLDSIQEAELFKGVSERVLTEIANEGEELTCEAGTVLFDAGEDARHIYELVEGSVDPTSRADPILSPSRRLEQMYYPTCLNHRA